MQASCGCFYCEELSTSLLVGVVMAKNLVSICSVVCYGKCQYQSVVLCCHGKRTQHHFLGVGCHGKELNIILWVWDVIEKELNIILWVRVGMKKELNASLWVWVVMEKNSVLWAWDIDGTKREYPFINSKGHGITEILLF